MLSANLQPFTQITLDDTYEQVFDVKQSTTSLICTDFKTTATKNKTEKETERQASQRLGSSVRCQNVCDGRNKFCDAVKSEL